MSARQNDIIEFIQRRFKKDCDWLNGNCYYFALILKDRFPEGTIYYDVIDGHFIYKYHSKYYDWGGIAKPSDHVVEWDKFAEYDSLQKERIIQNCIL